MQILQNINLFCRMATGLLHVRSFFFSFASGPNTSKTMKGRISIQHHPSDIKRIAANHASVIILAAIMQFPAFFSACTPLRESAPARNGRQIYITWTNNPIKDTVDLFFFDTSGTRLLDAYQRVCAPGAQSVAGLSLSGVKRLVALRGLSSGAEQWYRVRNYSDLSKTSFLLENDAPQDPLLWGEVLLEDASYRDISLALSPLLTRIHLRSVSCDFSTQPYSDFCFFNKHLYLSYAGAECRPLGAGDSPEPFSWLNPGFLDSAAVLRLPHPEMLLQEGLGDIGPERIFPDREFYCYPGRQTCLVLGGRVGADICYYPIPLRDLRPGQTYELDITLLRKGAPDPDMPVESGTVLLETFTEPWTREETQEVTISLDAGDPTKADFPDEGKISDWNLLIFNAFGDLEDHVFGKGEPTYRTRLLRDVPYTIVAAANLGYRLPIHNLADARAYRYHLTRPDDYRDGIPMAVVMEDVMVTEQMSLRLERLMARLDLRLDRRELEADVLLKVAEVSVGNCPSSVTLFPGSGVKTASQAFTQGFTLEGQEVEALNRDLNDGLSGTVSLYLLENCSDTHPSHILINAEYHSPDYHTDPGERLIYRVPLDPVVRNTVYPVTVKINN